MLVRARCVELEGWRLISAVLVDITRRTRAEARLATAHRRLEVALAGAELGAWQRDLRTDLLEVIGPLVRDARPAADEDGAGDRLGTLVHPEDQERLRGMAESNMAGMPGRYEVELRLRHADGRWIPVLSRGEVIERDAEGHALVLSGTHYDLSAQHASAAARMRSERMRAGGFPISRRSTARRRSAWRSSTAPSASSASTRRWPRSTALPVEAHLGRPVWDLVPDLREAAEPLLRRVLDRARPSPASRSPARRPRRPACSATGWSNSIRCATRRRRRWSASAWSARR